MKLVVTGANGQLGRATVEVARSRGHDVRALSHAELAVEVEGAAARAISETQPDFVIHCGAWTDVDGCEHDPKKAEAVNGHGTRMLAAACHEQGAGLVYVSTDFVFDGKASEPYPTDAPTNAVSEYGKSKLSGESAVLSFSGAPFYVVRTSWVFGPGGKNFPAAILNRARGGHALRVVDDQRGSPTYTWDLADALLDIAEQSPEPGIYHGSNEGICSWHGFATDLVLADGLDVAVDPMPSSELDRPAERPAWSALCGAKLAIARGRKFPHYTDAIRRYLEAERAALSEEQTNKTS